MPHLPDLDAGHLVVDRDYRQPGTVMLYHSCDDVRKDGDGRHGAQEDGRNREQTGGGRRQALAHSRNAAGLGFYGTGRVPIAANTMPTMVLQVSGSDVPTTGLLLSTGFVGGIPFSTLYAKPLPSQNLEPGLRTAMMLVSC